MPRKNMQSIADIRRAEIAAAALGIFASEGAAQMTLERIAHEIGASKSIILHYYASKDALMACVIRATLRPITQDLRKALSKASDPLARARVQLAFATQPAVFTPAYSRAFLTLSERSHANPALAPFYKLITRRIKANLNTALIPLIGKMEADPIGESLLALIFGLWMRRALSPESLSPQRAHALLQTHLEESIAMFQRD